MSLKTIRLELARTKGHPDGDSKHTYVLHAPLKADGALDAQEFKKVKKLCSVTKKSPDTGDEVGSLIHSGKQWAFSYAPGEDDDEPIFRLNSHCFRVGEYVSITEHDGEARPFRVVSIQDSAVG